MFLSRLAELLNYKNNSKTVYEVNKYIYTHKQTHAHI